jgi:tetratricopeptide (TPR) repeat protein
LVLSASGGFVVAALPPRVVRAEDEAPSVPNVGAARSHFDKARAFYGQGAYREALVELEAAHALDPSAKDLVFNLGVVNEKLANIEEALTWFRLFTTMDLTLQERERAGAYIRRLEGAKKELSTESTRSANALIEAPAPTPTAPPSPLSQAPSYGRFDGLTAGALTTAAGGLLFGVVMAVRAKHDEPPATFTTGRDGSYDILVNEQTTAHREAVLADLGFGVALVGAVAAAYLYFGRVRTAGATTTAGSATVSATPLEGGARVFVQGSF